MGGIKFKRRAIRRRVMLALEHKGLAWQSHLLKFDQQEHKAPQMLAMNPRGKLPVLRDGDYVVFESLAILYYLDRKYPARPIFGSSPEEAAVIMRVICEYQAYIEPSLMQIVRDVFGRNRLLSMRKSSPIISGMRWSEMMTAKSRSARMERALSGLEMATTW